MSKRIHSRLATAERRLFHFLGGRDAPESVKRLIPVFDDWPTELMSAGRGESLTAERAEEIKRICRSIAERARGGEFRDLFALFEPTPGEALQGLVDHGLRLRGINTP